MGKRGGLEGRLRKGGYGADEDIPEDYRNLIALDRDWQESIRKFLKMMPEKIHLKSGEIDLDEAVVLDLGTGPGVMADEIKDRVKSVVAMDIEQNMTQDVQERLAKDGKVKVIQGDFLDIPLDDNSIDLVVSAGTSMNIPVERADSRGKEMTPTEIENRFLTESLRVLKPGGVYMLNGVWNGKNEAVASQFVQKRQKEIERYSGSDQPSIQRSFVFSSKGLEQRLEFLGYKCKVDLPGCGINSRQCDAKITLLEKLK